MTARSRAVCMPLLLVGLGLALTACGGDSATAPGDVTAKYTVTLLASDFIDNAALNDSGQVAVSSAHNMLFHDGTTTDLGSCYPRGLNDAGAVICDGHTVWQNGSTLPVTFAFPTGFHASFVGINDQEVFAGTAGVGVFSAADTTRCAVSIAGPGGDAPSQSKRVGCAFIADASGHVTIIEPPAGTTVLDVPRMSHSTDVLVFTSDGTQPLSGAIWRLDSTSIAYACAGLPLHAALTAAGGNHEVVGYAPQADDSTKTDAIVCTGGVMKSLGANTARANDISRNGLIVGTTDDGHGFLWNNGQLTILDKIAAYTGARIASAECVNDSGQIVAIASDGAGQYSTVLLTPK